MDYAEALKKTTADKTKENFMLINFSYDKKVVLPYKDGVAFMQALSHAELLTEGYNEPTNIAGLDRDAVTSRVMSHAEYIRIKVATLLGIKLDEVLQYEKLAKQPVPETIS